MAQMEAIECGAACLAMVLGFYGHRASLRELRRRCGVSRDGVNAQQILEAAASYGLAGTGYRADVSDLSELPLPAILHWDNRHFVVLERIDGVSATLVDPGYGRFDERTESVVDHFSGVVLVFEPTVSFQQRRNPGDNRRRYAEALLSHRPAVLEIVLASVALSCVGILLPVLTQVMIDDVLRSRLWGWFLPVATLLFGLALVRALLAFVRGWVVASLQGEIDYSIGDAVIRRLAQLPLAFFDLRKPGDLIQRIQGNAAVREFLSNGAITIWLDSGLMFTYVGLTFFYSARIATALVILALLRIATLLLLCGKLRETTSAELVASGREWGILWESLSSIDVVRSTQSESLIVDRWDEAARIRLRASWSSGRYEALINDIVPFWNVASLAVVLAVAMVDMADGRLSVGGVAAVISVQALLATSAQTIALTAVQWQHFAVQMQRLDDILDEPREPAMTAVRDDESRCGLTGDLQVDGLTAGYVIGGPAVVQLDTLRIVAGEKVGIVGANGSGKSTLVKALLRVVPTTGVMRCGTVDVTDAAAFGFRSRVGYVCQDTFLPRGSIAEILRLYDRDAPIERLRECARMACIAAVIESLDDGYYTILGDSGYDLSAGERQRLSIARALVHRPVMLLLDEATSALDEELENLLIANLDSLGLTRLIVSHRRAPLVGSDQIIEVKDGVAIARRVDTRESVSV